MKRRLSVAALCLISAGSAWSLDAEAQRLADRYRGLVEANPTQDTAFERLWKIYAEAGETDVLVESARAGFKEHPRLGVRLLIKAGLRPEAVQRLSEAAKAGDPAAAETLADLREEEGDLKAAAGLVEQAVTARPTPAAWMRLGTLWSKAGETQKSREAWEKAVQLAPRDLGLRAKLGEAAYEAGEIETATVHWRVIANNGTPTERFTALERISQANESIGRLAEAIEAQQALLALMGPGHWKLASARHRLIALSARAGQLESLEKRWKEESERSPNAPEPAIKLAELAAYQGDAGQRLYWLRKAAALLPKDQTLTGSLAALELAQGHFAEAAAAYDRILARQPDHVDVIFLRAEVDVLAGQEDAARDRIRAYLASRSDDPNAGGRAEEFYRRMRMNEPLEEMLAARVSAARSDEAAVVELARFYLDQALFDKAEEALHGFDASSLAASDRAAVSSRFADLLLQAGLPKAAELFSRQALKIAPGNPQYILAETEMLNTLGQTEEAGHILREAAEVRRDFLPREDVDRRYFVQLQGDKEKSPWLLDHGQEAVQEMVAALQKQAEADGTENDWLRLARWQRWADNANGALTRAVQKYPESIPLQEALAAMLAETGDVSGAIKEYSRLGDMAPERSLEIQRKIGRLELDRGNMDEALRIFEAIRREQPKDWKSAADLALAEQMAGNWYEARDTWEAAYHLAPGDARRGLRQPLMNATVRLQMFGKGLDFYEQACREEKDDTVREQLLREAAVFAQENRVANDWRSRLQKLATSQPMAAQWKAGLAYLLAAEGHDDEARRLQATSMQNAEESRETLESLLKAAEAATDWDEAARLAGRLGSLRKEPDAVLAMREAEYLERAGRFEKADAAWTTVAARFARSPEALMAAADYFARVGDDERWEKLYRQASELGGGSPQIALRLGLQALDRGDKSRALDDFEAVLKNTRPDLALYKDSLPLPAALNGQVARPSGVPPLLQGKVPSEDEIEGCRLLAIQQAGQLLRQSPGREKWLEQFSPGIEQVWAWYFSGETDRAFAQIEAMLTSGEPESSVARTYVSLLLEQGDFGRLARWCSADPGQAEKRWDQAQAALTTMLESGWKPRPEFFPGLIAVSPALPAWHACRVLAQHGQIRLAAQLGEKITPRFPASQSDTAWMVIADWYVALGDPDGARRALDRVINEATPEPTYANAFFIALRARWLLTPESERTALAERVLARLKTLRQPHAETLAAALLAELGGESARAAVLVEELFARPETENVNWRELVNEGGARAEDWQLPRLARDLYRNDLKRDPALLAMKGENLQDLSKTMLIHSQLASAKTRSLPYLINEWVARGVSDEELMQAFLRLQQNGRVDAAAAVYGVLCQRVPRNEIVAGALLNALAAPSLREAGTAYYQKLQNDEFARTRRAMMQNAGMRLAQIYGQEGELEKQMAMLTELRKEDAVNRVMLLQHVDTMCRLGRHRDALIELENSAAFVSTLPGFALPAARLFAGWGREREAIAILEREMRNTASSDRLAAAEQLRELSIETSDAEHREAAETLLTNLGEPWKSAPATKEEWEKVLRELDQPGRSKTERFQAGAKLLNANPTLPEAPFAGEMARLQKIAKQNRMLQPEYYLLRKSLAARRGDTAALERDMLKEWEGGRGGNYAGEILLQMFFEQERWDEAAAFLDAYLVDAHFNELAWEEVGRKLLAGGRPREASRVLAALTMRAEGDAKRKLLLAEALEKSGESAKAAEIVARLEEVAALDRQRALDLSRYYLAIGQAQTALRWLERVPSDNRTAALRAVVAKELIKAGDRMEGKRQLLLAGEYPDAVPAAVLADFYENQIETLDPTANEFALSRRALRELQIELLRRLADRGQSQKILAWLAGTPGLLEDERARSILRGAENEDWEAVAKIWQSADSPRWEVKTAAAAFYLRKFEAAGPEASIKDLARAHELHPGSFAIAQAYAKELLSADKAGAARKALQEVINSYASVADRRAAREMLLKMQASPSLPKES